MNSLFFFFQAEDGIRDGHVTGVQTCALPISVGDERDCLACPLVEEHVEGVLHRCGHGVVVLGGDEDVRVETVDAVAPRLGRRIGVLLVRPGGVDLVLIKPEPVIGEIDDLKLCLPTLRGVLLRRTPCDPVPDLIALAAAPRAANDDADLHSNTPDCCRFNYSFNYKEKNWRSYFSVGVRSLTSSHTSAPVGLASSCSATGHETRWSSTIPSACIIAYTFVGPTKVKPRLFIAFDKSAASSMYVGRSAYAWRRVTARLGRCAANSPARLSPLACMSRSRCALLMVASILRRLRMIPSFARSPSMTESSNSATMAGSKPANASRNASRRRRMRSQLSPTWNTSRLRRSKSSASFTPKPAGGTPHSVSW